MLVEELLGEGQHLPRSPQVLPAVLGSLELHPAHRRVAAVVAGAVRIEREELARLILHQSMPQMTAAVVLGVIHEQNAVIRRIRRSDPSRAERRSAGQRCRRGLLCQGIGLAELEAGADDAALFRTGGILDVGGRDEGAVAEEFEIGVAAVGVASAGRIGGLAVGVVEEFDAVLTFAAVHDVLEGADPRDVVTVGGARFCHVAEGDDEAPIGSMFDDMAIPGERGRQLFRLAPGACIVRADRIERLMLARVFAHEHDELFSIIGPRHARLGPLCRGRRG